MNAGNNIHFIVSPSTSEAKPTHRADMTDMQRLHIIYAQSNNLYSVSLSL